MPLDRVLIKHLDNQDILEDEIEKDIESLISQLSVDDLMDGAEDNLMTVVETIQKRLETDYYTRATENGIMLAKDIIEDGDIKVPDSNNPDLNEGIVSDDNGEN